MGKKPKNSKSAVGVIVGSILRTITLFFGFIFKVLFKILTLFGLWLPLAYALFGLILYLIFKFNPFVLDVWGTLYLCGAVASVVGALIIAVRNVIVKPAKSVYQGYKHPIWEKNREEKLAREQETDKKAGRLEVVRNYKREAKLNPPEIEDFTPPERDKIEDYLIPIEDFSNRTAKEREAAELSLYPDWLPKHSETDTENVQIMSLPSAEKPQVYFSKLEPDLLIHEYADRFETFRVCGGREIPLGVEYKE